MTTNTPNPPSGWYPDARDAHLLRYWNGLAWTAQTRPVPSAAPPGAPPAAAAPVPAAPTASETPQVAQPLTPHGYPPAETTHPVAGPGPVPGAAPAGWGAAPMAAHYCRTCSAPLVQGTAICPRCGTVVGIRKDKTTAVLLAVFLGPWTWLYTYQRDAWKFWTSFAIGIAGFVLIIFGIGLLAFPAIWIWSIVDVAVKDDTYYKRFPNG